MPAVLYQQKAQMKPCKHINSCVWANDKPGIITANADEEPIRKGTITAELKNSTAHIRIQGYIGGEKANAEVVSVLVDNYLEKGITDCVIHLSTGGGSVFEADDIISELKRFTTAKIEGGALIASAGTMFLVHFPEDSECRSNTQFMLHKPSMGSWGNEDDIESSLTALKNITAVYRKGYAGLLGKTEEEIEALWSKGDKWFTATEAKKIGLIKKVNKDPAVIDQPTAEILASAGAPVSTPANNSQPTNKKMDREQLIASLKLPADATDAQITAAIEDNRKKAEAHDAVAKNEKAELESKAKTEVTAAITAKKVTADQFQNLVTMYVAAPEQTKAMLDAMPVPVALSEQIDGKNVDVEAARKDWKVEDWLEKDPVGFAKMEKDNPAHFKALNNAYFGTK